MTKVYSAGISINDVFDEIIKFAELSLGSEMYKTSGNKGGNRHLFAQYRTKAVFYIF